jgi:protein SCO1/2
LFITVDPRRDSATHLKDYVAAFGPTFIGLTGTVEQVDGAARAFRVRYVLQPPQDPADPDTYFVDHSAGIYIMDRQGGFVAKMGHRADPEEVAARLLEVIDR